MEKKSIEFLSSWLDDLVLDERKVHFFVRYDNLIKSNNFLHINSFLTTKPSFNNNNVPSMRSDVHLLPDLITPQVRLLNNKKQVIEEITHIKDAMYKKPIGRNLMAVNRMYNYYESHFFNEPYLSWIDQSDDLMVYWLWLYVYSISSKSSDLTPISFRNREDVYTRILELLDNGKFRYKDGFLTQLGHYEKLTLSSNMKYNWSQFITNKDQYDWLNKNNESQCYWAWKYIQNKEITVNEFTPINHKEAYIFTLVSLSVWELKLKSELKSESESELKSGEKKKTINEQIQKAWKQREFRAKSTVAIDAKLLAEIKQYCKSKKSNITKFIASTLNEKIK